ncbi:MAG: choice-of-anchor D domain-containing protein, partial [Candidatus Acidiferrum sp.]
APAVTATPNPVSFPSTVQGVTSSPIPVSVLNSGNATLHISSVTLAGNNAGDFTMTNGCIGPYAPNAGCTITLTFTPLAAGQRSALISIADDAPNSTQSIQVGGTATPAPSTSPAVTFSTTSVSFPAITQGTAIGPQNITVTSSGGATLPISSIVLGGANSSEFSLSNGCTAKAYAVNATCTIGISFAPVGTGARAATVTLTDNATNSPQIINLGGFANSALTLGAAPAGSTSATISAGQTAQYNLQITPGAGFTGSVSFTYSGAPLGAAIQGPSSLQISNGSATPFMVSVTTSGASSSGGILPFSNLPRLKPFLALRALPNLIAGFLLLLLLAFGFCARHDSRPRSACFAYSGGLCFLALFLVLVTTLGAAGCGGGSSASTTTPPPLVVTPQGISNIVVMPAATSVNGQPLQLQPIQLTLTVN